MDEVEVGARVVWRGFSARDVVGLTGMGCMLGMCLAGLAGMAVEAGMPKSSVEAVIAALQADIVATNRQSEVIQAQTAAIRAGCADAPLVMPGAPEPPPLAEPQDDPADRLPSTGLRI